MRRLMPVLAGLAVIAPVLAQTSAEKVMADARTALGGEAKIAAVKTFIATGRTRQVRGENLVPIEFEIQAELPDKYSRYDEFPAQDAGPVTAGFVGDALVLIPRPPAAPEAMLRQRLGAAKQDFARLMLGMFATATTAFPLTYSHVGQAEAPQGKADVIEAKGPNNFTARVFIAGDSRLPIMLSWQPPGPPGKPVPEQRLFFADYREVNGLKLPFRIRRAVGTDTTEETTFDRYRINVRIDPRRFDTTAR